MLLEKRSGTPVNTHGLTYDAQAALRFRAFVQQMPSYRSKAGARRELRSAFGDSYMYYYFLVTTPAGRKCAPWHWHLGSALSAQGRLEEAALCFRLVLRLSPDFAVAHCDLGDVLHAQGKLDEAAAHYREALRLTPDSDKAREKLERIKRLRGEQGGPLP